MGLIKALANSVGASLGDQWKEYFYCDSLAQNVLMCKGQKQQTQRGTNFRGESNIISNGSVIAVNEGQCALIVEDGKIVELTCEPGRFVYDTSSEPSIFAGEFGQSLKDTFKQIGKRFTFGGSTGKDQRVYFINIKPIENNLFGTYTPIPFRFVDENIGADIDLHVRCRGRFSYTIDNPIVFYTRVAANVQDCFTSDQLLDQLRAEFITYLQAAFAPISSRGVRPSDLLGETIELVDEMNKLLKEKWLEMRGLKIFSIAFESISVPDDEQKILTKLQETKVFTNSQMAAANFAQAQADALRAAASNENAGAFMAFAGMNMANATGNMMGGAVGGVSPQVANISSDFETRLKKLEMLKGKIPEELYNKKMEELLADI
ncbi:SPFH domain-containing protein [Fibrobacter sp.]|uniref:SPFH domain-containing protein n=1 Tax=Fibrobacter sp. TaxID=35828 RepID=UPI00388EC815